MQGLIPPQAWDIEWTGLDDGVILNQTPAWSDAGYAGAGAAATTGGGSAGESPTAARNRYGVTTHTVPIGPNSGGSTSLLGGNAARRLLVLQNNSTATGTDVAPSFYFGFGQIAQVGQGLALAPGVGMVLDVSCPVDAVFLTIGASSGSSVKTQGAAVEGVSPAY